MKRLTVRTKSNNIRCLSDNCVTQCDECEHFNKMVEKLADYEDTEEKAWTLLTDDEESYPKCFEYVLIEDEIGDKNVACCHPDYEWYISNGEDSLKLIGNIIKWRNLSI